jgi:hypothetical protein
VVSLSQGAGVLLGWVPAGGLLSLGAGVPSLLGARLGSCPDRTLSPNLKVDVGHRIDPPRRRAFVPLRVARMQRFLGGRAAGHPNCPAAIRSRPPNQIAHYNRRLHSANVTLDSAQHLLKTNEMYVPRLGRKRTIASTRSRSETNCLAPIVHSRLEKSSRAVPLEGMGRVREDR